MTENLLSQKDKMSDSKRKETKLVQIHNHSLTGERISLSEFTEFCLLEVSSIDSSTSGRDASLK